MIEEWYSYGVFRWTRDQNMWVIRNWEHFEAGDWPPNPWSSSYTELPNIKKQSGKEARFIKPKDILAEIKYRLKKTKTDGKLLMAELNGGSVPYENLQRESRDALDYISIWDFRKRQSYPNWLKQRVYRQKL